MIRDARRLFAKCESAGDTRGAVIAHRELRDTLRFIQELIGIDSEDTPGVEVRFVFDSPEDQRRAEEIAARTTDSGQCEAATARTSLGPDSAIPEDDEAAQPDVVREAHRVEETVAASAEPRVSAPEAALPSPFQRFGPLAPPGKPR